jgi:hypothetical protein
VKNLQNSLSNGVVVTPSGHINGSEGKELANLGSISNSREWSEATCSWISRNAKSRNDF